MVATAGPSSVRDGMLVTATIAIPIEDSGHRPLLTA
jgi:hypothetical protein